MSQRSGEPHSNTVRSISSHWFFSLWLTLVHAKSVVLDQYDFCSMSDDTPISFLPLPATFNHMDSYHWAELSGTIQSWLVALEDTMMLEWTWGWDTFLYAFVAANPDFPTGKWAFWDPSIPLEGQFIKQWVGGSINLSAGDTNEDFTAPLMHADTLDFIWTEFSKHIVLFYPYPLFSTT